jgi:hypothetical protein
MTWRSLRGLTYENDLFHVRTLQGSGIRSLHDRVQTHMHQLQGRRKDQPNHFFA